MQILQNYKKLTRASYKKLKELGIDIDDIWIDHIGYQCSSSEEYEKIAAEIAKVGLGVLQSESIVDNRRVGIYKLNKPLSCRRKKFSVVEFIEPKEGQVIDSSWEHAEFLSDMGLEKLMEKYPKLDWDANAINREIFPMISLKLNDNIRAKFPRLGVLEELKRQKSL